MSLALSVAMLAGCAARGPVTLPSDSFDYGEAIADSRVEQMLLGIVKSRYADVPTFLSVSSVIAGYTFQGNVSLAGQAALGTFDEDFVSSGVGVGYVERPTITYTPLQGPEFARRLMTKLPAEMLFSLVQSGWPADLLMKMAVDQLGPAKNLSFLQRSLIEDADRQIENTRAFDRVVEALVDLQGAGGVEVLVTEEAAARRPTIHFPTDVPPDVQRKAAQVKRLLGLSPALSEYPLTGRATAGSGEALTVRTRSLYAIMASLGLAVDIPERDRRVRNVPRLAGPVRSLIDEREMLRIQSGDGRPDAPYTAVRYAESWFYVDGADFTSRRALAALVVLFELTAPDKGGAAPFLTLPTG